ncbi:hypothetical protein K2173_002725 [Erythroxylum novogranatense]|uniref:Reverse transcriptase Ty1/copia-type domain-containing protein n=1 Tax=Erythroxylum novogranatense TaxID=1862640 RepID=A0AAV8TR21_9ROSI|nr:hypothetical protein K2173_002725 [Erythroxylum novogranatense]
MDVKTAFLNGNLLEDVYMIQPEGFVHPKNSGKVCKLQRSIYGLKQASRSWNLCFDEVVKEFGFIKNEDEPCVYKKVSGSAVVYGGLEGELVINGYTDASFQSNIDDFRSQSGFVFCLNGGAEAVWIRKFITELGVVPSIASPIDLYCDNNGAIAQAK